MPKQERVKTIYPGVYFITGESAIKGKPENIYYIFYRKNGKQIEEKVGRQYRDDMTPAKAARIRALRLSGDMSNQEKREKAEKEKQAESGKWTISKLWVEYHNNRKPGKSLAIDTLRYKKYIEPVFGGKEPKELMPIDVDRVRIKLSKTRSPQTVKHVLNLLTWVVNFGVKKNLCAGLPFHIQKPTVYNVVTEDLNDEQLKRLMDAIEASTNVDVKAMMRLVLCTGMRRGELLKLQWSHIDFDRGFIKIKDPKGGIDQTIPLNDAAREILESHHHSESEFVFPGVDGGQRVSVQAAVNKIKKAAGLPKDFRPMHGLRHLYASMLASSGRVDMYTLQRLLTHKDPRMTQRYAHLRDGALRDASNVAGDILNSVMNPQKQAADVLPMQIKESK
jgi:integrase